MGRIQMVRFACPSIRKLLVRSLPILAVDRKRPPCLVKLYLLNAYRVPLTRARQGLIVFVPHGDAKDPTRPPTFYDETYAFLVSCGIPELE